MQTAKKVVLKHASNMQTANKVVDKLTHNWNSTPCVHVHGGGVMTETHKARLETQHQPRTEGMQGML